jgi:phage repressor protein C with HTH and peptisase S24 domain
MSTSDSRDNYDEQKTSSSGAEDTPDSSWKQGASSSLPSTDQTRRRGRPSITARKSITRMASLEEIDNEMVEDQIDEMLGAGGAVAGGEESPVLREVGVCC